ncbi:MAG: response regulator [Myxococcales bacterium]|nr:response regulator [Myxococcales bacterium]
MAIESQRTKDAESTDARQSAHMQTQVDTRSEAEIRISRRLPAITFSIAFVVMVVFVFFYQQHVVSKTRQELALHAAILAPSLWNFDDQAHRPYMELAARANDYAEVTVLDYRQREFMKLDNSEMSTHDRIFSRLGLMPIHEFEMEIQHAGEPIGTLRVLWRNNAVDVCISVSVFIFMIATGIWLLLKLAYTARARDEKTRLLAEQKRELEVAVDKAEAANLAKSVFLANMSHELRTPLNAILGFSEILQPLISEPSQRHYFSRIRDSGKSLLRLINDILDLSKIEAGKLEVQYSVVSLSPLFREIEEFFAEKLLDKGLGFTVDIAGDVPDALLLDEIRLRQILLNIVGNAVKFTESGSITLAAKVESVDKNHSSSIDLVISVADTGIGIPESQRDKIFSPFEQQDGQKQAQYGGTGLGLAIVRQLLDIMNGTIIASARNGSGSVFTVVLKGVEVAVTEQAPIAIRNFEEGINFETITFAGSTILIADDIDYNRELLKGYLEQFDLNLIEAKNGIETLTMAQQHRPDLILLDMKMPEMDGYEASARLKEDANLRNIPVVAITASALKQDEDRINRICDGYLRKPTSKADVVRVAMQHLRHTVNDVQAEEVAAKSPGQTVEAACPPQLAPNLVRQLREASAVADIDRLRKLIDQVAKNDVDFALALRRQADQYSYDGIARLVASRGKPEVASTD